jgi:hypothetical protein
MSKLMSVLGIILLAVGLAIGLLEIANPGHLQGMGVNLDTAVTLLVGGILAVGLGGVIAALERGILPVPGYESESAAEAEVTEAAAEPEAEPAETEERPARKFRLPGFGRRATATSAAAAAAASEVESEETTASVQETIDALEQAKNDIKGALGGMDSVIPDVAPKSAESTGEAASGELAEGELYVIEEKVIRGRPARILSDSTVEAETDEGWMRFENVDHLNEYLDSAGE